MHFTVYLSVKLHSSFNCNFMSIYNSESRVEWFTLHKTVISNVSRMERCSFNKELTANVSTMSGVPRFG